MRSCVHSRAPVASPPARRFASRRRAVVRPRLVVSNANAPPPNPGEDADVPAGVPRPPRSRVLETSDASRRRGAFASAAAAAAFGAAALAAPLAAPPFLAAPAHAASAAAAPASPAVPEDLAKKINPNLIQLPEPVRQKIDQGMMKLGDVVVCLATIVQMQAQDPWSVEDIWLILLWRWLIRRGRRKAFDALHPPVDGEAEDARDARFDASVWTWLEGPMKAINTVWIVLYVHDNVSRMFLRAAFEGGYFGFNFDLGMYVLGGGAVAVMAILRWLPGVLHARLGITEGSLQTVLTRLATILVGVASGLKAGLLFGVPASSMIGAGGVGGLTFGLAARDVLSNVMGGTMIAILRPFTVGEEIFVTPGNNFRGSNDPSVSDYLVEEVGWYQTTLRAKDTKPTIVPNGYFLGANVINVTRAVARVLILDFRVLFQDRKKIPAICSDIEDYLRASPYIASESYPVRVNFGGVKEDCVTVAVETHMYKFPLSDHLKHRATLVMDMLDIAEKHTTGPAYPTEVQLEGIGGVVIDGKR